MGFGTKRLKFDPARNRYFTVSEGNDWQERTYEIRKDKSWRDINDDVMGKKSQSDTGSTEISKDQGLQILLRNYRHNREHENWFQERFRRIISQKLLSCFEYRFRGSWKDRKSREKQHKIPSNNSILKCHYTESNELVLVLSEKGKSDLIIDAFLITPKRRVIDKRHIEVLLLNDFLRSLSFNSNHSLMCCLSDKGPLNASQNESFFLKRMSNVLDVTSEETANSLYCSVKTLYISAVMLGNDGNICIGGERDIQLGNISTCITSQENLPSFRNSSSLPVQGVHSSYIFKPHTTLSLKDKNLSLVKSICQSQESKNLIFTGHQDGSIYQWDIRKPENHSSKIFMQRSYGSRTARIYSSCCYSINTLCSISETELLATNVKGDMIFYDIRKDEVFRSSPLCIVPVRTTANSEINCLDGSFAFSQNYIAILQNNATEMNLFHTRDIYANKVEPFLTYSGINQLSLPFTIPVIPNFKYTQALQNDSRSLTKINLPKESLRQFMLQMCLSTEIPISVVFATLSFNSLIIMGNLLNQEQFGKGYEYF